MSLNVTHQIISTLSLQPEPSSSSSSSNLFQMVPPEPSALTTSIMTAQNDDYIEMNPAVSTSLNRSSSTSSPNLFANSEPQTVNSLTTGITSQITVTSPNPLHSSNRNSSGRRRLSYENNNSSVMSNSQVTENSSLYHHHPNIQHPMLNTVIPGGASSPSLFPLPTTRSNNGAVSNLSASSSSNGTNTMISIADAILLSNDYKIPSDNHSAHSRGMNSSQQNTLGQSLTNQLSSMSLGFEPSFAPNSHENYTYLYGKASTSPRKGVARQLRKNQPNITTQPVTTEKSIVANSPHVNHADSDDRAEVVDEKDEFFRVVGVKPSSHPQNSRVSVYIAPIPAPAPLQSPARTSQTSPPPPPTVLSAPSRLESLKEIDTCKIDTSKILVRFTTGDSGNNGTNEKTIQAEWKGRARRNEVYGCSRRRELLTFGATSSDKSGTVPFNTLCKAAKLQSIYLAADLRDAGLFQGGLISSLSLKISDVPDRTIENFRIACSFTSDDHFTEFMDPNELAVVFGPTNLVQSMFVVNEWISFELIKPIEWDGRSNLVLELSKDEVHSSFSWPATGGIYFKSTTSIRTVGQKDNNDSSGQYPFGNWNKPSRFRRVPFIAIDVHSPPCYKIVCSVPLNMFTNNLVNVDVALDGCKFTKFGAMMICKEVEQTSTNKLISDMSHLVENERLSDVVFLVGPEEKRFAAHQVILAARSETFARLFKGTRDSGSARNGRLLSYDEEKLKDAEKQDDDEENKSYKKEKGKDKEEGQIRIEIKVPELSPEVFQCLLRYLYTSAVDIKLESACELFKAADMYHLSDLKRSSEEFLKQNTTIENVTSLLLSAQKFQVQSVRSYCLDYLLWHFDPVSKDPSFARDLLPNTELIREILLCRKKFKSSGGSGRVGSGSNLTTAITLPGYGYTYGVTSNSNPNLNAGPGLGIGVSVGGGVALGMQNAMASPGSSPQLQSSTPQTNMSVCFPNSLIKDLKSLLVREPENVFADVLFVVGQEVSDTPQIFDAHKVILCTRCEIFDAMFRTPTFKESTTSTIHIPNIRPTVFSCLLSYLYLGTCPLHYDNAFELYTAADQYMLSDLKLVCEDFLMTEVSIDNVADVLLDADETGVESVRKGAIELVVREFDDVSVTSRFLKEVVLRQDLMLEILQSRGT